MRILSNFSFQDATGKLTQIPVRYGDMNRQVAQIMKKNSENTIPSAPFIACYIKGLELSRDRMQDPTFVSKVNIRERAFDDLGQEYLNVQGENYTVERLMPTPFNLKLVSDIWCTNTDQKLQILEQIIVLFNPALEIQTSNNYIDWTSLTTLELTDLTFSSRQIPQGVEQDIDIATLGFETPIWITPPAKVKKLGIITKIITSIYDEDAVSLTNDSAFNIEITRKPLSVSAATLGNLGLLIIDNTAKLVSPKSIKNTTVDPPSITGVDVNWNSIIDRYPGQFIAGLSQIRLMKADGNEIVGFISLNPTDDYLMQINWDTDTVPMNTLIYDLTNLRPRGTVDAVINPQTFNPRPYASNGSLSWPLTDTRYLILEDITYDLPAWENQDSTYFTATANDIIQWDGAKWNVIFNSATITSPTYITNSRTGIQYAWDGTAWLKSYDGLYDPLNWRLVL